MHVTSECAALEVRGRSTSHRTQRQVWSIITCQFVKGAIYEEVQSNAMAISCRCSTFHMHLLCISIFDRHDVGGSCCQPPRGCSARIQRTCLKRKCCRNYLACDRRWYYHLPELEKLLCDFASSLSTSHKLTLVLRWRPPPHPSRIIFQLC